MKCRHCHCALDRLLIDLGTAPPSNAYLGPADLQTPERWYPLRVFVCESCWLVQTEDVVGAVEMFDAQYAYFSGFSSTWLSHCEAYAADMIERFKLGPESRVVEVASNDGSLLQYFRARGVPCLGIEPTAATADAAREKGIEVVQEFFGVGLAREVVERYGGADLIAANNVLAHVPDINDFVAGFAALLKPAGIATFEFPRLTRMIDDTLFDTIYHEHFSYLSLSTVARIFEANGLSVFDAQPLPTHGGSLRVFAQRSGHPTHRKTERLAELIDQEHAAGVTSPGYYAGFQRRAERIKHDLLAYLVEAKRAGKVIAAYGAAAKGNTLLNYAGVRPDLLACVADRNPAKQGRFMPGSRVPIVSDRALIDLDPDIILILPWNLKHEVAEQLRQTHGRSTTLVVALPELEVLA